MVVALEWIRSSLAWYYFVQILGAFPATTGKTSTVEAWFRSTLPSWKSWSKFSRWNWWVWLVLSVAQLFCHFHLRNCFEGRIIYRKERFYDLWIFIFKITDIWTFTSLEVLFSYILYYFDLSAALSLILRLKIFSNHITWWFEWSKCHCYCVAPYLKILNYKALNTCLVFPQNSEYFF